MGLLLRLSLTSGLCALSACTSSGSEDAGGEVDARSNSVALLSLERFVDADSTVPRLVAGAKVARFYGIEGDALLNLLGADVSELESCRSDGERRNVDIGPNARVDLLTVGDITVRLGATETHHLARVFTALPTVASGV
jgi:hypothetical protein